MLKGKIFSNILKNKTKIFTNPHKMKKIKEVIKKMLKIKKLEFKIKNKKEKDKKKKKTKTNNETIILIKIINFKKRIINKIKLI
jgi:hypothetical protein